MDIVEDSKEICKKVLEKFFSKGVDKGKFLPLAFVNGRLGKTRKNRPTQGRFYKFF